MLGLPAIGTKVRVWPARKKVQRGRRPIDHMGGGQAIPREGADVIWSEQVQEQMKHGEILLHPLPDEQAAVLPPEESSQTPPAPDAPKIDLAKGDRPRGSK